MVLEGRLLSVDGGSGMECDGVELDKVRPPPHLASLVLLPATTLDSFSLIYSALLSCTWSRPRCEDCCRPRLLIPPPAPHWQLVA